MTTHQADASPKRQSCDRCHGQKLRCIRESTGKTDPCVRCLRQGMNCVYSATLRKGRRPSGHGQGGSSRNSISITPPPSQISPVTTSVPPLVEADFPVSAAGDIAGEIWSWESVLGFGGGENNLTAAQTTSEIFGSLQDLDWTIPTPSPSYPPGQPIPNHNSADAELWSSNNGSTAEPPDVADDIAQLSELIVRLYPLYRSSSALSATRGSRDAADPLVSDAIFESIAGWLVPGETHLLPGLAANPIPPLSSARGNSGTNILQVTLSASCHLLSILRSLQGSQPFSGESRASSNSWIAHQTQPLATNISITRDGLLDPSGGSNTVTYPEEPAVTARSDPVVRHLVLACHTLLLNTYSALLAALQHDADLQGSWNCLPGFVSEVSAGTQADMRIVMVVQFSSYFIHRLHQAVEALLSSLPSSQRDSVYQRSALASGPANLGPIHNLTVELQRQLLRLRQTLRI